MDVETEGQAAERLAEMWGEPDETDGPDDDALSEMRAEMRAALAAYAHDAWIGWMRYFLPKLGMVVKYEDTWIPSQAAFDVLDRLPKPGIVHLWRWIRQIETPYDQLSEREQQSDLAEADKILELIDKHWYI